MCQPDPVLIDYTQVQLPNTWPDEYIRSRSDLWGFFSHIFGKRQSVRLPENFPGIPLPRYLLQEFHNLPNGNFSNSVTKGYIRGFDLAMLGYMKKARRFISQHLREKRSVLEVGSGGGKLTEALKKQKIPEIWGMEPSLYLLKVAATRYPKVRFIQGLAESIPFPNARFEGIGVCFVFHELPKKIADQSLQEIYRVLKPGGLFAMVEPSPEQFDQDLWDLFYRNGPLGLYFGLMARHLHEPYVAQWHKRDLKKWFKETGFQVLIDRNKLPFRYLLAQKME